MIGIGLNVRSRTVKSLDELVDRLDRLKAVQRDRILHPRVVCVKGDNIFHTHFYELLQGECTVQRLTAIALMLAALVEERHDDVDPARFSADGCDDALQILKMIVRRHVVRIFPTE